MRTVSLKIEDSVYDKVMYLLKLFPQKDVKIIQERVIEEIDVVNLPKNHFDYMSEKELEDIDKLSKMIKDGDLSEFDDFEKLKNAL